MDFWRQHSFPSWDMEKCCLCSTESLELECDNEYSASEIWSTLNSFLFSFVDASTISQLQSLFNIFKKSQLTRPLVLMTLPRKPTQLSSSLLERPSILQFLFNFFFAIFSFCSSLLSFSFSFFFFMLTFLAPFLSFSCFDCFRPWSCNMLERWKIC